MVTGPITDGDLDTRGLARHPDWAPWYFEVRDAGENYAAKARGYVMALNKDQAKQRLTEWVRTQKLSRLGGVQQPIDSVNVRIMVHPDPFKDILGKSEDAI